MERSAGSGLRESDRTRARPCCRRRRWKPWPGAIKTSSPSIYSKALIDDPEALASHLVRDAGGDPDLLKSAAEERLARLPKATYNGPQPIFMSPQLAAVLQGAGESRAPVATAL